MNAVLRLFLVATSLTGAVAAFCHAASENGSVAGLTIFGRASLNGNILSQLADRSFRLEASQAGALAPGQVPALPETVARMARASFAVDPLEVNSLRSLALGQVLHMDEARARQAMRLAPRISKRDAITNLWLAQDYGQAGSTQDMLASFDQALRTSVPARQFAMKPLVETLASQESYVPLGQLLARHPEWEEGFWQEFFRNPVGLANAERFFTTSGLSVNHFPVEGRARLYTDLKRAGAFASIVRLAGQDPGARTGQGELLAGKFVTTGEGNPFGWTLHSKGTFATQVTGGDRELVIDAEPGAFGLAADRVASVEGEQELSITLADPLPDHAALELSARCAGAERRQLASLRIGGGQTDGRVVLSPASCKFVSLMLSFTVEQGRHDASIHVTRVTLRPLDAGHRALARTARSEDRAFAVR